MYNYKVTNIKYELSKFYHKEAANKCMKVVSGKR